MSIVPAALYISLFYISLFYISLFLQIPGANVLGARGRLSLFQRPGTEEASKKWASKKNSP